MPGAPIDHFPLFILGIVVLPGEITALHVFEERYKAMVAHCLEHDSQFGIVLLEDEELHTVGCSARISDVIETFDDGRMSILIQGTKRFELVKRNPGLPYPAGTIVPLSDLPDAPDDDLIDRVTTTYADLVEIATDERPEEKALTELESFELAATVDLGAATKQRLLEICSERKRMEALEKIFSAGKEIVTRAKELDRRAKSNGKVKINERPVDLP